MIIAVAWDHEVEGEYWTEIVVDVLNERGVLAAITTGLAEQDANIADLHVDPRDGRHNSLTFMISVNSRTHLAKVMRRLRSIKSVTRIYRKRQG